MDRGDGRLLTHKALFIKEISCSQKMSIRVTYIEILRVRGSEYLALHLVLFRESLVSYYDILFFLPFRFSTCNHYYISDDDCASRNYQKTM